MFFVVSYDENFEKLDYFCGFRFFFREKLIGTGRKLYQSFKLDAILVQTFPAIHNSVPQFSDQPNNRTSQFMNVRGKVSCFQDSGP